MIMTERRIELVLSIDRLSRLSGVPKFRCCQLEAGIEYLRTIPFYQSANIAKVLDIPLEVWYDSICSDVYSKWTRESKLCRKL